MQRILTILLMSALSIGYVLAQKSSGLTQIERNVDCIAVKAVGDSRPLIGITPTNSKNGSVLKTYTDAILRAGGVPIVIVVDTTTTYLNQVVNNLDGLLLTGGEDINPFYYSEAPVEALGVLDTIRDVLELTALRLAVNRNIPVFGVCRGCQLINVAMGGSLYQDLPTQNAGDVEHQVVAGVRSMHNVSVAENSVLQRIVGKASLQVNSSHHQAVKGLANGARIGAKSDDGVIESIDFYPAKRVFGVQWHPEGFLGENEDMNKIFNFFIKEASLYKRAKLLHSDVLSIDTHTDAPLYFNRGMELGVRCQNQVNVPKMQEGMLDSQFLAAFVGSAKYILKDGKYHAEVLPLTQETCDKSHAKVLQLIHEVQEQVAKYSDICGVAYTEKDARDLKAQGKKAFFIGVENGIGLSTDLGRLYEYKDLGVRYVTLTHSYDNQICNSSSHTEDASKGLTKFGRKLVKEMNKIGILIDLSHASEGTFWDVLKLSNKPVFCSHSGAKAICDVDRNLTDNQLRALAANGGVVQAVALDEYLHTDKDNATIEDYIRHIDHMVKVAGINHVGIGTDFDGGGGVPGFNSDSDMINVTMSLMELGYSNEDIEKLLGKNFFRILRQADEQWRKK